MFGQCTLIMLIMQPGKQAVHWHHIHMASTAAGACWQQGTHVHKARPGSTSSAAVHTAFKGMNHVPSPT
jgi:hypothetical protein